MGGVSSATANISAPAGLDHASLPKTHPQLLRNDFLRDVHLNGGVTRIAVLMNQVPTLGLLHKLF
jgi:hypothetical protein